MRLSEFWSRMEDEFGSAYAASLARDHALGALGSRTAVEAIAAGVPPREIWLALCDDMDVPAGRRYGTNLVRPKRA